jgi:hypothetical protein
MSGLAVHRNAVLSVITRPRLRRMSDAVSHLESSELFIMKMLVGTNNINKIAAFVMPVLTNLLRT